MMKVSILGAGIMGTGIAQIAVTAGWEVVINDTHLVTLERSSERLKKKMRHLVSKGEMDKAQMDKIIGRITFTATILGFESSQLVIEAVVEDLEVKQKVLTNVERVVGSDAILASNTSSLSLASIGSSLRHPSRFVGIHFFNPPSRMPLVEVTPSVQTAASTVRQSRAWMESWGKVAVIAKDTPGFIVNRVARPFYGEALRIYEEGIATFSTIDWAMKAIGGFPMGPFELMDFIGNDVNYAVTEEVFKAFYYDPRYKPSHTQKRMIDAGLLGRKTGNGYYDYSGDADEPRPVRDATLGREIMHRVLVMLINEAADALHLRVASKEDIDLAMTKGVNYPKGLLRWADELGIDWCVEQLDRLYDEYREDRYRCSPLLRRMDRDGELFYPR